MHSPPKVYGMVQLFIPVIPTINLKRVDVWLLNLRCTNNYRLGKEMDFKAYLEDIFGSTTGNIEIGYAPTHNWLVYQAAARNGTSAGRISW